MNCIFKEISKTYSHPGQSRSNTKRCLANIYDSDDTDDERVLLSVPSRFLRSSDEKPEEEPKKKKAKKVRKERYKIVQ